MSHQRQRPAGPGERRRDGGRRRRVELAAAVALMLLLALDLAFPPPIPPTDRGSVVVAADGTPLRTWPGPDGVWRQPVTPEQVSPRYLQALLGYEDRWFRWHPGVNPVALARAAVQWVWHGRVVSGGSTLTMQVARILEPEALLDRGPQRWRAKLRQIARALQLELRLSKREILTLYLNHAPMGGIVEGVEMASRTYLGRPAGELGAADAALLAALPQSPSRLRPDRDPRAAQAARDKVLDRMAAIGAWTAADVADAKLEQVAVQAIRAQWIAPLAAERLRRDALAQGHPAGEPVRSTLDVELQTSVERLLLDRVARLPPKVSMAALVIDNDTLAVRAYAGSADFGDRSRAAHVDMVRGVRSPGSTLKPFLYALALDQQLVHAESLLIDAPQSFGGYQPGNFQAAFSGPVSLSEALQKSLNVPAVDLLDRLGPARFAQALRAGGLRLRLPRGAEANLSLILGGAGTTLEELVGAYRALARGGVAGTPRLQPDAPRQERRMMSEGAAYIVRDILEGGGRPDRAFTEGTRRLAWKTGTSFGFRDAWAVGVTDQHTLGVWIGRPDGTPNPGTFGANAAAPLLHDLVAALNEPAPGPRTPPPSVTVATTCWPLGLRAEQTPPAWCLERRPGWLLDDAAPPTLPDRWRSGGLRVALDCPQGRREGVRWPAALEPFLDAAQLAAAQPGGCTQAEAAAMSDAAQGGRGLRIQGLEAGTVLQPVPGAATVDVQVATLGRRGAAASLWWMVDGRAVRRSRPGEAVTLRFDGPGPHSVTVLDESGRHHRVAVTVRGG